MSPWLPLIIVFENYKLDELYFLKSTHAEQKSFQTI